MVKRVKPRPVDIERLLARGGLPEALASLRRLEPDSGRQVATLLDLLEGPWRDLTTPMRAAALLTLMHEGDALLGHCLEMADDWAVHDDDQQEVGRSGIFRVLSEVLDEAGWRRLLQDLGDPTTVDNESRPSWPMWVNVLADCGGRGLRSEQAWAWLQRVLDDTPPLWCIYAGAYGDARAVPTLQALLRGHADLALVASGPRNDDDDIVIEAATALERLGCLDQELQTLRERHRAALLARAG
jgi:hypothetical protein